MELTPPATTDPNSSLRSWNAEIPLHLRYLPSSPGGTTMVSIPWPVVFWACPAEQGTKMSVNPFDRINLGYDGLFGPHTMFYHLQPDLPAGGELVERVKVPVLDSEKVAWIENGTITAVLIAVVWVVGKLWRALQAQASADLDRKTRSDTVAGISGSERRKLE
jgi:hypothetical protein